jgi:NAD+ synthase
MPLPVVRAAKPEADPFLKIQPQLVVDWLVEFLRNECIRKRGMTKAIIGLSGGIDSAVTTALAARAFGPDNVHAFLLPYRLSSQASLDDAYSVAKPLGIHTKVIDISAMVDGCLNAGAQDADGTRIGNICARSRATVLFDQSAALKGLPIGTGNKTERFFGYYTWHADDSPPINPLGDLYKTQVWEIARTLGIPDQVINKPPTADLVEGQTDEDDFGISYDLGDRILSRHVSGQPKEMIIRQGFQESDVDIVIKRVAGSHWKRHMPTVAMLSDTSINDYYLRPVDYRGTTNP